jgi:biopolymer transport protein ExbD
MSRRRFRREERIISDVNITPLVDTCLVLLIMFMIATPIFVTQAVPVSLPSTSKGIKVSPQNEAFVTVSFSAEKGAQYYYLQDKKPVSLDELGKILSQRLSPQKKETVFIYSDGKTPMDSIITLSDIINQRGGKVYIVTKGN